jgi:hypothetical protein
MIDLREKQIEKIKNATDSKALEHIIENFILEMKKNNFENYQISNFIRRLDIALLIIERKGLSDKEWDNIQLAKKILIDKGVY